MKVGLRRNIRCISDWFFMRKQLLLLILIIVCLSGCSSLKGAWGANSSKQSKQLVKVELLENKQSLNTQDKLFAISPYAFGINYSLNTSTNREDPPIKFAKEMNDRIVSLSPSPTIEEINEIKKLFSLYVTNVNLWKKEISVKDQEILGLQLETKKLQNQWNIEIDKYKNLASATALKTDTLQAEINDYKGWFGLKAVGKGLWQFAKSAMWILSIGGILFIVLRFASLSNPLAASVFSIFTRIGSWVVNTIEIIAPKAVEKAGHVAVAFYDEYNSILSKIVDNIQNIKQLEQKTGKKATLEEVLIELDKSLDQKDKDVIDKIKKELGYN